LVIVGAKFVDGVEAASFALIGVTEDIVVNIAIMLRTRVSFVFGVLFVSRIIHRIPIQA
jgi:hypothetical protein